MKYFIKSQAGQSTIEFIFTFAFGVSVILMIFNSALNHTSGYLVHYATFMASRSYLTADNYIGTFGGDQNAYQTIAEQRARETFNRYNLSIFNIETNGVEFNHTNSDLPASDYLTVGTYTFFDQRIDVIGRVAGAQKLELTSESYLGKEPTRFSCAVQVCKAVTNQETCDPAMDVTLFDDGC